MASGHTACEVDQRETSKRAGSDVTREQREPAAATDGFGFGFVFA